MRDLFSDNSSGYRLKTLQIFNWGVFDKKTVTFSFNDKSTILTGLNGSGKTTTVDAILTLLIPPNKRFYNLSSESSRKRERDEKNYTLGAYGLKADDDGEGVSKYLRKKNEVISILNGIFHEEVTDRYLTLLQVRYFSGEELKCIKIITEKELRIEDITLILERNNTRIAQNTRWVPVLVNTCGSRVFDSFVQYQNFFMDKFGFRSDNALKLFSQTVGLKVLGDITSFIRMYMLEDRSPVREYEQLNSDFANITKIELEMRKTEKEIEFLSRVVKNGDAYSIILAEKNSLSLSLKGLESWFVLHALRLAGEEKEKKKNEIDSIKKRIEKNEKETEENDNLLFSLQSDDRARAIMEMTKAVEDAEKEENGKRKRLGEYNGIVSQLRKLGVSMKTVESRDDYSENTVEAKFAESYTSADRARLYDERDELLVLIKSLDDDIRAVRLEIESLEKRENNIPSALSALRERMSCELSIPLKRLPFLGELINVKQGEKEWHKAIGKLLEDEALMLVLSPSDETVVSSWLDRNNLKDRIGIIRREEIIRTVERTDLLGRIEIKEKDNPLNEWIEDYLSTRYPHVFVSTMEEFEKNEYALMPSGLARREDIIVKDDRVDPFTKKTPYYLGWSNKERLEELTTELYSMNEEFESFRLRMDNIKRNINDRDLILKKLEELSSFSSYEEIDRPSALGILEEKKKERAEFLASNSDLEEKERRMRNAEEKKKRLKLEYGALSSEKGAMERELHAIEETERKFHDREADGGDTEAVSAFVSSYQTELIYDSLDSLIALHTTLFDKLKTRSDEKERECLDMERKLENSMNAFLNPPRSSIDADIDWSGEFSSLVPEAGYYPDFKDLYTRKVDEDITSLREEFNSFLEKTLSNVIGTLAEALNSWEKEIDEAVRILNRNLLRIPFNSGLKSHLRLEKRRTGDKDYQTFRRMLSEAIPDKLVLLRSDSDGRKSIYKEIKKFLDKYNGDEKLKRRVLDLRNNYRFTVYEDNSEGNISTYADTAALSGGEKAKLTYTILAAALCYQYNLDNEDEKRKGPFRFVILDEAFSKSDANNSIYALELFKELDLQLMVVTPRNGINLVEGYINSLHLIEKKENTNTSTVSTMTIEEYRKT